MESNNSKLIKEDFRKFSEKNNFAFHDSEPLIAPTDSRLLFNISGGVKYQSELLGLSEPKEERVSSIQKCIRTDGMKSIGYSGRHHLFFEMIGHFMFYCASEKETKEEFIKFAYDFLYKEIGLDKNRLYVTVHPQDEISLKVLEKLRIKNIILSSDNVFVSPYANKSSLRTEIKWQRSDEQKSLVELWNLVFTQFDSKKIFHNPSKLISADSGASLERIVSAYENKNNNYENSMWNEYIMYITSLNKTRVIEEYRRLADFFNVSIQMINEGVLPGNKVQPYMLRKMLRIIFNMCEELEINVSDLIDEYVKYNNLLIDKITIYQILKTEIEKYYSAIQNGMIQARKLIKRNGIDSATFEYLKSSCGLPEKYINMLLEDNETSLTKKLLINFEQN